MPGLLRPIWRLLRGRTGQSRSRRALRGCAGILQSCAAAFFTGRIVRPASLLVKMSRSGEVGNQVLGGEEPAGDAAGVLRGRGTPVHAGGQPGGADRPVAGDQAGQDGGIHDGLTALAGGGRDVAGPGERGGHLRCPVLLARLEAVPALQIPEQVRRAPGVQCTGEVPVPGRASRTMIP